MGFWKWLAKKLSCASECAYNASDFADELLDVDLSKYQLKISDLMAIQNIVEKRPSKFNYKHDRKDKKKSIEV